MEQARKIQMSFTLSTPCDNELMFVDTAIIFNFVFAVFFFSFVYLFVCLISLKSLFLCFVIIASLCWMRIRQVRMS